MKRQLVVFTLLTLAMASSAFAQYTINTLAQFNGYNGAFPNPGVTLAGGTLYGTTQNGGNQNFSPTQNYGGGDIFSVSAGGVSPPISVVAPLNAPVNGYSVLGVLGSTLYANTGGSVSTVPANGGTLTPLTSVNTSLASLGSYPNGLTISGNTLYGTTSSGGTNGLGEVFSVSLSDGTLSILGSFNGTGGSGPTGDDGSSPYGNLYVEGSTLYGTASGGAGGQEIFSVPLSGGAAPTATAIFSGTLGNGVNIFSQSGNTLYATTTGISGAQNGELELISVTGNASPTVLGAFSGGNPTIGGLVAYGNNLYGTTEEAGGAFPGPDASNGYGADGYGGVFSVPLTGGNGAPTVLASMDGSNGIDPEGALAVYNGTLYGTTYYGDYGLSQGGYGTIFSVSVPEPTSASLLAIASLTLFRRTRRRSVA